MHPSRAAWPCLASGAPCIALHESVVDWERAAREQLHRALGWTALCTVVLWAAALRSGGVDAWPTWTSSLTHRQAQSTVTSPGMCNLHHAYAQRFAAWQRACAAAPGGRASTPARVPRPFERATALAAKTSGTTEKPLPWIVAHDYTRHCPMRDCGVTAHVRDAVLCGDPTNAKHVMMVERNGVCCDPRLDGDGRFAVAPRAAATIDSSILVTA